MSIMSAGRGKRLVVLGGGLSGLSYVHYLRNFLKFHKKEGMISKITILEANDYMGGSIKSTVFEDGSVHEHGPRSVRNAGVKSKNTAALIDQLGLNDRVLSITAKSSANSNRYVYRSDQFWRVPSSIMQPFTKLPASKVTMLRTMMNDFFKTERFNLEGCPHEDPSVYDFVAYRFGVEAAESVLDPLLRGITAGDARKLSTRALFNDLFEAEQKHGSVIRGSLKPPIIKIEHDELFPHDVVESKLLDRFDKERAAGFNLSTGLQTLPEHLSNALLNTNDDDVIAIYNRTKVLAMNLENDDIDSDAPCYVTVQTIDGDTVKIEADHIVSCITADQLVKTIQSSTTTEQRKAFEYLNEIPHRPVGCVTAEFKNLKTNNPTLMNSFGFLTHSQAGSKLLGVSFDSTMFPEIDKNSGSFRLTCMMGGEWYKEVFGTEDINSVTNVRLEQIALEELQKLLGVEAEPVRMSPYLWKTGIAQYRPGHVKRLVETRKNIENLRLPLTLLGQSYDGVAVNDVIFAARMAASKYVKAL